MGTGAHSAGADKEVCDAVLRELTGDSGLTSRDINAAVRDGVVTLTGFVRNALERTAAERAAKRIKGVKAVANDIEVKAGFERSDPEIARDSVNLLRAHPSVPHETIMVTVQQGRVTLEGSVSWQYQLMAATAAIKRVRGVNGIENKIVLEPKPSPTRLRSDVEHALRSNPLLDNLPIRIEIAGGTVRLYGPARIAIRSSEAEQTVRLIPGVSNVESHLG
jgi:osmotically-inducible protein OsmY